MIHSKNWCGAKLVNTQPKNFFSDGITEPVKHWNQCIKVERDYAEKQY
jgi:hypothetical protein